MFPDTGRREQGRKEKEKEEKKRKGAFWGLAAGGYLRVGPGGGGGEQEQELEEEEYEDRKMIKLTKGANMSSPRVCYQVAALTECLATHDTLVGLLSCKDRWSTLKTK